MTSQSSEEQNLQYFQPDRLTGMTPYRNYFYIYSTAYAISHLTDPHSPSAYVLTGSPVVTAALHDGYSMHSRA
mgnify:CR=1 FL=1